MSEKMTLIKFVVLMLLSVNIFANEQAEFIGNRLAQAMQLGETLLLGYKMSIQNGVKNRKVSQNQLACINKINISMFTKPYANGFDSSMTDKELETAIEYYESLAGKKKTQQDLNLIYKQVGLSEKIKNVSFSDSELKKFTLFSKTSAGNKIIKNKITQSQSIKNEIKLVFQEIYYRCLAP